MRYKTKPVEVEAVQFISDTPNILLEIQNFMDVDILTVSYTIPSDPIIKLETPGGIVNVHRGDYIVKGLEGEFYPCKPEPFRKKYELIK